METIIWATDGSSGAEEALPAACQLAELSGGQIVAVHISNRFNGRSGGWSGAALEEDVIALIEHEVDDLRERGYFANLVVRRSHQDAAETIASMAGELHADVIVCGTHGRSPAASALLGSFTQRLLHVAPCPVFAVPPTAVPVVMH
jgi:nucleotide-binding universal stress UspA family protein